MKLFFIINYATKLGQRVVLQVLEDNKSPRLYQLQYKDHNVWEGEVDYFSKSLTYKYQVLDGNNHVVDEEIISHHLQLGHIFKEYQIIDTWNAKNFPENYLNNKIFVNKKVGYKPEVVNVRKSHNHFFRIEAPLYNPNWALIMIGDCKELGFWDHDKAFHLTETDYGVWETSLEITGNDTIFYKYGIYDKQAKEVVFIEDGDNRLTYANKNAEILQIKADHYFVFNNATMWHAAGVAIPVFAMRSEEGFGVGEFLDLKALGDWAYKTNLSILQILPINDTTANYTWTDSYPYAAISVYALHPQYLAVDRLDYPIPASLQALYDADKKALNDLALIDYEKMISGKWKFIKAIFSANEDVILKDKNFKTFVKENEDWLMPYSSFCVLRDKYKTPNYNLWKTHNKYIAGRVASMYDPAHKDFAEVMLHAWVQYQLHLQLTDAINYIHTLGVSVKGDLPIGIYRYSVEAWTEPELFGMDYQAGAPPDQFSDLGQNWEFPTYNWEVMAADGYQWWKKRFNVLERYFDAMRIDHILGFFRIWRMPISATQGVLGYFYPAIPITKEELAQRGIYFDKDRFCKPFANEVILNQEFGEEKDRVVAHFFNSLGNGVYQFKTEYDTQRKLTDYFLNEKWDWIEGKLINLASNVIFLIEVNEAGEEVYHPRFNYAKTSSFSYFSTDDQHKLHDLYNNYFFQRQDDMWYDRAMEKLPALLTSTNMLICGEDLGLVPDSVPVVMDQLAITALKVQRMPSDDIPYYNPKDATYLNVVTASSHDSSTLRQWWHEDRAMTQDYFNNQLHQFGTAPWDLTSDLSAIIMKQHLYTDAMLAIFPIQEFLATDDVLMNQNMDDERINIPAIFPHYWRYRMHLKLEDLIKEDQFNTKIADWIKDCKRN